MFPRWHDDTEGSTSFGPSRTLLRNFRDWFPICFFKLWGKKWVYTTKRTVIPSINPSKVVAAQLPPIKIDPFFSLSSAPSTKKNSGMGVEGHRRNSWKISPTWISLKGNFPSLLVERVMSGSVTSWRPMSTSNTFCSSSVLRNISKFYP